MINTAFCCFIEQAECAGEIFCIWRLPYKFDRVANPLPDFCVATGASAVATHLLDCLFGDWHGLEYSIKRSVLKAIRQGYNGM